METASDALTGMGWVDPIRLADIVTSKMKKAKSSALLPSISIEVILVLFPCFCHAGVLEVQSSRGAV